LSIPRSRSSFRGGERERHLDIMKLWVGLTDDEWFGVVSSIPNIDEVNFWQPGGGGRQFRILQPGEPFLFKLHSPQNYVVGGGFFAHWTKLPISLAWEAFGEKNGAKSYEDMRRLIIKRRGAEKVRYEDFGIGCVLLEQPFFLPRSEWLPVPSDWRPAIQQGKQYSLATSPGKDLWESVQLRLSAMGKPWLMPLRTEEGPRYGDPVMIAPRLGQGTFRVLVTDAYRRSCAITGEHSLPVLEAAHIKPFSSEGPHVVNNGLLLRSDFHRLFDRGYITVTPEYQIKVGRRLNDDFKNGRYYYPFDGRPLSHLPLSASDRPQKELLIWHNENVFRG